MIVLVLSGVFGCARFSCVVVLLFARVVVGWIIVLLLLRFDVVCFDWFWLVNFGLTVGFGFCFVVYCGFLVVCFCEGCYSYYWYCIGDFPLVWRCDLVWVWCHMVCGFVGCVVLGCGSL